MRIDEIDLYGGLLINGSTGSNGQVLTYNESGGIGWGTASGSPGSTSSYFKTSGYNYVICETVNTNDSVADALTNGTNLQNAYNLAKNLDVGGLSVTNRVVVLLMPGDYDIGDTGQFYLDTSFVDLVGISSNPYDTILRSSTQFATLFYTAPVDSALKNIHLKQGTNLSVSDAEGAGDGSYLRWENLILVGNLFSDGITYGFSNIYGEFRNIKILDNSIGFVASVSIDGIFENIEAPGTNYSQLIFAGAVTSPSTLTGTFSNINFNVVSSSCFANNGGVLSGYYENINILDGSSGAFQGRSVNGTFKNIRIGGGGVQAFYAGFEGDISGTYENIQISDSANSFYSVDRGIYGTYKNIQINNSSNSLFMGFTVSGVFEDIKVGGNSSQYFFYGGSSLLGSFKNIEVGDVSQYAFSAALSIDATFENIKVGNANYLFLTLGSYLQGTFSNIESGDANTPFYSAGTVSGYFSDIKLGNSVSASYGCFKGDNGLTGTFKNIEVGDMPNMNVFHSNGEVSGIFKNIKIGESTNCFQSESSNLLGTFENIEFGKAYSYAFNSFGGNVDGTFDNIKTSYSTNYVFYALNNLTGTFSNIEVSQIDQLCFYGSNQLSGSFKNIKIGDLSGIDQHTFFSGSDLTGTFENIEVGNGNASYDIFKSGGNISGTFSNISIGDNYPQVFSTSGYISGYYKDITIGNLGSGRIFFGTEISVGTTIDNLYSITRINGGTTFKGRLINSTIIDSVNSWQLSIDVSVSPMPIVENCKLITNGGGYSILPVNGGSVTDIQVLYTATNETTFDDALGDALMTPNYNIADASLT
jgi:hypothetical protein